MAVSEVVDRFVNGVSAPIAGAVLAASAALASFLFYEPGETAFVPCPLHATTGIFCPGCGSTRALHSLTHGDFTSALHNNALFVIAIPIAIYAWVSLLLKRLGRNELPMPKVGRSGTWLIGVTVLAFMLARNVGVDSLAPIAYQ